ncbi:hypothetical protein GOX01_00970 [Gluconobacter oxydans]|nr:hypothetical protein GOX01_00970 [Gluconobacter oxydans]
MAAGFFRLSTKGTARAQAPAQPSTTVPVASRSRRLVQSEEGGVSLWVMRNLCRLRRLPGRKDVRRIGVFALSRKAACSSFRVVWELVFSELM